MHTDLAIFPISQVYLKTAFSYTNFFVQMALLVPYMVVEFAAAHLELFYA